MAAIDITDEDQQLVKKFVLIPIILDVLERDIKLMKSIEFKMGNVYIRSLRKAQNVATKKLSDIKQEMRKRGLKVYESKRTQKTLESKYLCRGYHHEFSMLWSFIKAEVERSIAEYMDISLTDDTIVP